MSFWVSCMSGRLAVSPYILLTVVSLSVLTISFPDTVVTHVNFSHTINDRCLRESFPAAVILWDASVVCSFGRCCVQRVG